MDIDFKCFEDVGNRVECGMGIFLKVLYYFFLVFL